MIRKSAACTILFLLAVITAFGKYQTNTEIQLDSIIERHIEAHGGMSEWTEVFAMQMSGQYTSFSVVHDFYTVKTSDGLFFSDYNLGKHRIQEGFDGNTFWTMDPWQELDFPRKLNKAERHVIMQKAEFFTPLFRWQQRGYSVKYGGTEVLDGNSVHVIMVKRPGMPEETWYIDAISFLAVKYISQWVDFTYPIEAETWFDDYRSIHGLLVPFYIEQTYGTRHTITQIEEVQINPDLASVSFNMPTCPHMEKIMSLAGTWQVQVERMNRLGNWQPVDQVLTDFKTTSLNTLKGSVTYEMSFQFSTSYTITYNRLSNLYQLVVYDEFYSATGLYEGTVDDQMIIFSQSPQGIADEQAEQSNSRSLNSYVFSLISDHSFEIEKKRSTDEGKSWSGIEKLSFSRI